MRIEALYRDGHKEQLLLPETVTLAEAARAAHDQHPSSQLKFLKVVDHDQHRRRVDG